MTPFAIDGGILFFFCRWIDNELAVFIAGWGSNNKFSMLGAMRADRADGQLRAAAYYHYASGGDGRRRAFARRDCRRTKRLQRSASCRIGCHDAVGRDRVSLFFVSSLVESNRTPFDVPEGESEIVAGHMTEYSGFKYALFFMAEYFGMFAVSGLA